MDTTKTAESTVTPPVDTTVKTATHKHNEVELTLVLDKTAAKGEKKPMDYYRVDFEALDVIEVTKSIVDGKEVESRKVNEIATAQKWVKLYGFATLRDSIIAAKANNNLKATQLKAGKDEYSLTDKLQFAKDYIDADFGALSKGGIGLTNAVYKAMEAQNATMATITKRLVEIGNVLFSPTASIEEKMKLQAEFVALQQQATAMQTPAKK